MPLIKAKGNMYDWITHHWNPIKGQCEYECFYCYVPHSMGAQFYEHKASLNREDLRTHLGRGKIIFVGSMVDMWGSLISKEDILKVLSQCLGFPENEYIFQSKNPARFWEFLLNIPFGSLLGTTIETDEYPTGFETKAPSIIERLRAMEELPTLYPFRKFVTIEPIMDFNLDALSLMIHKIRPEFVTIGADSKGHELVEPSWERVEKLIHRLRKFTEIRQKSNLERLKA